MHVLLTADLGCGFLRSRCFFNDLFSSTMFSFATIRTKFVEAGIIKLGHLTRMSMGALGGVTGIKSSRVLERIMEEIVNLCHHQ